MNKKLTRRVVLGTIIGGLAAGPFVIRALRKGENLQETDGRGVPYSDVRESFFQEWKEIYNSLAVKKQSLDSPKTITVKYDFSKPKNFSFRALETHFSGKEFKSPETARLNNISYYTLLEGTMGIRSC